MSLTGLLNILQQYQYYIFFPLIVVEGPMVTVLAGFLASMGIMNVWLVYVVAVVGDLTGDCLYYVAGRWGGRSFLGRWGHYVGVTPERVEKLENHFHSHAGKTLMVGKISHAIGGIILAAAGFAKVPFGKFFLYNGVATIPKSALLVLIGFYFGESYNKIGHFADLATLGTVVLTILLVICYVVVKRYAERIESQNQT